ncbi:MAG TPA: 3-dehydroquinate synthase family protein [Candidatus Saccharimonadales bacterium]|nr:3-dehydroquinate synthase family protein [Candidatus Saccharimonadales bacterium]
MSPRRVRVRLGARSYDVLIGAGLLPRLPGLLRRWSPARTVWLVTDTRVARLHAGPLAARLRRSGYRVHLSAVPPGERSKCARMLERLVRDGLRAGIRRDALLLALGGGVVGDLAGLVAGTYLRGLPWVQLPTTLLAQVDASVGGKVGVDVGPHKNSLGLFLQPLAVVADVAVLRTQSARQFRCGLAEAIKMSVALSRQEFAWLERHVPRLAPGSPPALLAELVARAVRMKAAVVAEDELDRGRRALLNFGHTLGHALEGACGYRRLLHGEAVAIGCAFAAGWSARLRRLPPADLRRVVALLQAARLPVRPPRVPAARLRALILGDKKQSDNGLAFVLTGPLGGGSVKRLRNSQGLARALNAFLEPRPAEERP